MVIGSEFEWGRKKLGTKIDKLCRTTQFTVPVRVGQSRVLRTRAKFDQWACEFVVETDPELVDQTQLSTWLDIAGRRIGLGDWRPHKSGTYGRFLPKSIDPQN